MTGYVGEVRMFAGSYVPNGWLPCDGATYPVNQHAALFTTLGTSWGGNGTSNFRVPDLRGRTPLGVGAGNGLSPRQLGDVGGTETETLHPTQMPAHLHPLRASAAQATETAPGGHASGVAPDATPYRPGVGGFLSPLALGMVGQGQPHENRSPVVGLTFGICRDGVFPGGGGDDFDTTIGEVRLMAGVRQSDHWLECDGRLLAVNDYTALFTVLGTSYGGNGVNTFALPDLRGRVPVHVGPSHMQGQYAGQEQVTLAGAHLPQHSHTAHGTSARATAGSPVGQLWAATDRARYAASAQVTATTTTISGSSLPHNNMPPFAALRFVIAAEGIYPSRDG